MSLKVLPPVSPSRVSFPDFETDLTLSDRDDSDENSTRLDHLSIVDHPLTGPARDQIVIPASTTMRGCRAGAVMASSFSVRRHRPVLTASPNVYGVLSSLFGALSGHVQYDDDSSSRTGGSWRSWEFDTRMFHYAGRSRQRRQELKGWDEPATVEIEWDQTWAPRLDVQPVPDAPVTGDQVLELEQRLKEEEWERLVELYCSRRRAAGELMAELSDMLEIQACLLARLSEATSTDADMTKNLADRFA